MGSSSDDKMSSRELGCGNQMGLTILLLTEREILSTWYSLISALQAKETEASPAMTVVSAAAQES
eukprot:6480429-Amphidinium_carterae.1